LEVAVVGQACEIMAVRGDLYVVVKHKGSGAVEWRANRKGLEGIEG